MDVLKPGTRTIRRPGPARILSAASNPAIAKQYIFKGVHFCLLMWSDLGVLQMCGTESLVAAVSRQPDRQ